MVIPGAMILIPECTLPIRLRHFVLTFPAQETSISGMATLWNVPIANLASGAVQDLPASGMEEL